MDEITNLFRRVLLSMPPTGAPQGYAAFSRLRIVHRHGLSVAGPFALLLIALCACITPAAQAQTTSTTATARFNKDVFVSATGEHVQVKDAVAVTYTLSPTDTGTQITLLCHYNGMGEGETTSRAYTLIGSDQQTSIVSSSAPTGAVVSSYATLTQVGSTVSVRVRIDYLVTITEDGDVIISITNVEVQVAE